MFEGCQNTDNTTNLKTTEHRSAVYVTNSTDIELSGTTFNRSSGRGLSLHGVGGRVEVSRSCFVENTVVPAADGGTVQSVGGGLHIVLEEHNKDSRYLIKDCMFIGNRANSANTAQFLPVSEEGSRADSGVALTSLLLAPTPLSLYKTVHYLKTMPSMEEGCLVCSLA